MISRIRDALRIGSGYGVERVTIQVPDRSPCGLQLACERHLVGRDFGPNWISGLLYFLWLNLRYDRYIMTEYNFEYVFMEVRDDNG